MRAPVYVMFALGLTACAPAVPDSGAGVGFQPYGDYLKDRTAGGAAAPAAPVMPFNGFSPDAAAAAIDKAEGRSATAPVAPIANVIPAAPVIPVVPADPVMPGARPRGNAPAGIAETTSEMGYATAGVSDEQDFQAVSARETIESDKARIEKNRAQYQVDQPGALPQRTGTGGPNIVEFALSVTHPVGTMMYRRSSFGLVSQDRACAKYPSPDMAQEAFLAAGGPDRDRKGLDPDGDGYACSWDPSPFRAALN
jgi:hypothetical protein